MELYSLRRVIDTVNQRYFEGQQVLFPKAAEGFDELIDHIDKSADLYNRNLAEGLDRLATRVPEGGSQNTDEPFCLGLSTLGKLVAEPGKHQVASRGTWPRWRLWILWGRTERRWNCWTDMCDLPNHKP